MLAQGHEEGHVRGPAGVLVEVRRPSLDVELAQDDVGHRERQRPVGARLRRQPVVGELGVPGEVGRHHHDLLAPVAGLDHEVGVRRPRLGDVRAPDDEIAGVPPVGRLGRRSGRPRSAARPGAGPRTSRRTTGGPRRAATGSACPPRRRPSTSRGWARTPRCGRPVAPDRVHVGRGDELEHVLPRGPHEPALAAPRPSSGARSGSSTIAAHASTGSPRAPLLAEHGQQLRAHVGVLHPEAASTGTRRTRRRAGIREARTRASRARSRGSRPPGSPRPRSRP